MIQLIIKDSPVQLSEDFHFTFKSENPYFTQCSNSTLDIYIPLSGCRNNLRIFGPLCRYDVTKKKESFPAKLLDNERIILDGTAVINQVTEKGLKIQLLSGNSEMNFRGNKDIYIDEMELGSINQPEDGYPYSNFENNVHMAGPEVVNGIFTPVIAGDKIYNHIVTDVDGAGYDYHGSSRKCAQPYFVYVLETITKAMGYTIRRNDIRNTPFKNLYICSAYMGYEINKVLPHWTVCEFLNEIEKFFSVVTIVDEISKTVSYIDKESFYDNEDSYNTINEKELLRSYEVKVSDKGSEQDVTVGNVGYNMPQLPMNNFYNVQPEILDNARYKIYGGMLELKQDWEKMDAADRKGYIFQEAYSERNYISYTSKVKDILLEINSFGPLKRDNTPNIDVELNIVPACMKYVDLGLYFNQGQGYGPHPDGKKGELWLLIPEVSTGAEISAKVISDFQETIENGGVSSSKPQKDILEVAFNLGKPASVKVGKSFYNVPVMYTDCEQTILYESASTTIKGSMSFKNIFNTVGYFMRKIPKVSSNIEYHFKFTQKNHFDVKRKFLIGNQIYLCKEINVEVSSDGMSNVAEGIFYKM